MYKEKEVKIKYFLMHQVSNTGPNPYTDDTIQEQNAINYEIFGD